MNNKTQSILRILSRSILQEIGTQIGKDLYTNLYEFIANLNEQNKSVLLSTSSVSFQKPATFYAIELSRVSYQITSYLLGLNAAERNRLINLAQQGANGDESQILFNLLYFIRNKAQ